MDNGVRVYIGAADVYLEEGYYTYRLRYRTDRQLGFFEDHDELYWNVTGNGWAFPIRSANATIGLPEAIDAARLRASGYTGKQGSTDAQLTSKVIDGGAQFASTMTLWPGEGLTVVLEFPKGLVPEPTTARRIGWFVDDNQGVVIGAGGLTLLWLFYGIRWRAVGRDPDAGPLVPLYQPPPGQSAASMRYLRRMTYDDRCFAAATLSLAAKGAIAIDRDDKGTFSLRRTDTTGAQIELSVDERRLFDALFKSSPGSVSLKPSSWTARVVAAARAAHEAAIKQGYEKQYFVLNRGTVVAGALLSLLVQALMALSHPQDPVGALVVSTFFVAFSIATFAALAGLPHEVKYALAIIPGFFTFGFLFAIFDVCGVPHALIVIAMLLTHAAFYRWMKAPTVHGAPILHKIEGFRWYLGVGEKQQLDSRYQPAANPQLFAAFLPHALALDVEQPWAERFASSLTPAQFEQAQPGWYRAASLGAAASGSSAPISSFASSFSSSIASASTPPGSRSGSRSSSSGSSGSSGRSGGGGGGGGGGGW
jgi:uncharacterized membrane protein YgcG